MTQCVEIKNPGEKLLRLYCRARDGIIESVSLTGDFFIIPEESVSLLESSLRGERIDAAAIMGNIRRVLAEQRIEMIGLSPETIATAILDAAGR